MPKRFFVLLYITFFAMGRGTPLYGDGPPASSCGWKVGDSWKVVVDRYPPGGLMYGSRDRQAEADKEQTPMRFSMRIRIVGSTMLSNATVWQVEFRPSDDASTFCTLWIRDRDRSIRKARYSYVNNTGTYVRDLRLEEKHGVPIIRHIPYEFPLQVWPLSVPPQTTLDEGLSGRVLRVQKKQDGADEVVEARVEVIGSDGIPATQTRFTQRWAPGRHWWTSYEWIENGRLRMRAWLDSAVPKTEPPSTTSTPK